jgi:hypothetical protein
MVAQNFCGLVLRGHKFIRETEDFIGDSAKVVLGNDPADILQP